MGPNVRCAHLQVSELQRGGRLRNDLRRLPQRPRRLLLSLGRDDLKESTGEEEEEEEEEGAAGRLTINQWSINQSLSSVISPWLWPLSQPRPRRPWPSATGPATGRPCCKRERRQGNE